MLAAEERRRGGVKGVLEGFGLAGVASSSLLSDFSGGVWFSELLGESVDILSRSLSDSSAIIAVWLLLRAWKDKVLARGLWWLLCRRLGRRKRWNKKLGSSTELKEPPGLDDGGRAKSEEDVGSDGLEESFGILRGGGDGKVKVSVWGTRS